MTNQALRALSFCLPFAALAACDTAEPHDASIETLSVSERVEAVVAENLAERGVDEESEPFAGAIEFAAETNTTMSAEDCRAAYCEDPSMPNSCADPSAAAPGICIVTSYGHPECNVYQYYGWTCPDMTPAEASTLSWDLKTHPNGNSVSAHVRLHLTDPDEPFFTANGEDYYLGYLQGYRLPNEADDGGGSWLVRDGQMIMTHQLYTGSWPPFIFTVGAYGRFDDENRSVTEGARIGLLPGYVDEGLWSTSQLGAATQPPTSGTVLSIDGCWEITTDWDSGGVVTADFLFDGATNDFQSQSLAHEQGHFAAVENGLGEQQLVLTFMNNGATLGGMLSTDCPGGASMCVEDGIGIIPMAYIGDADDYLDGISDGRAGSWSATYKGASCSS